MPDAIRNPSDRRGTGSSLGASQRRWSCSGGYGALRGKLVMAEFVLTRVTANGQLASGARRLVPSIRFGPQDKMGCRSCGKSAPDSVSVAVEDSGPGLDPANSERAFEAFYTTKPDGLGIGLSICRSIIEAHRGKVAVTANVPHGAIFQFTVPARGDH